MADKIEIIFLGTGDAFGSGGLDQTCFLVNTPGLCMLIDCGCAVLTALNREGIKPQSIDAIIISHFHGDHFGGIPFFIRQQHFENRQNPLTIYGPTGLQQKIEELGEHLFPSNEKFGPSFPVIYTEYQAQIPVIIDKNISFSTAPVEHVPETDPHAIRLSCYGKLIAYSGDTRWTKALTDISYEADIFICEVHTIDTPNRNHMHYTALLEHEQEINAKRIILTHCSDDVLNNVAQLKHELASHLKRIELPF